MNETLSMILVFVSGIVLGTLFFGGLWFTVKKAFVSKMPGLYIFSSFIFRISLTLAGFYYIAYNNWQRMLICLAGFVTARFIILRLTKLQDEKLAGIKKEVGDEVQS